MCVQSQIEAHSSHGEVLRGKIKLTGGLRTKIFFKEGLFLNSKKISIRRNLIFNIEREEIKRIFLKPFNFFGPSMNSKNEMNDLK